MLNLLFYFNSGDSFEGPEDKRFSSTRSKEQCCHLGVAVSDFYHFWKKTHEKVQQPAFYAKEMKPKMLAKPTSFQKIWNNEYGKGKEWISIYRPVCPRSYVALGHVITRGAAKAFQEPSDDDIRCVHSSLVMKGKWTKMWDSNNVPKVEPITVWRADSTSNDGLDASLFSPVNRLGEMDTGAYVLKRNNVKINWGKRVVKLKIFNEVYDFEKKKVISQTPVALTSRTTVNNCGELDLLSIFHRCISLSLNLRNYTSLVKCPNVNYRSMYNEFQLSVL